MVKKQSVSSVPGRLQKKSVKPTPDKDINFDDIPELTDEELSKGVRVYDSTIDQQKKMIALSINSALHNKIQKLAKKKGKSYQDFLQELLQEAVDHAA